MEQTHNAASQFQSIYRKVPLYTEMKDFSCVFVLNLPLTKQGAIQPRQEMFQTIKIADHFIMKYIFKK